MTYGAGSVRSHPLLGSVFAPAPAALPLQPMQGRHPHTCYTRHCDQCCCCHRKRRVQPLLHFLRGLPECECTSTLEDTLSSRLTHSLLPSLTPPGHRLQSPVLSVYWQPRVHFPVGPRSPITTSRSNSPRAAARANSRSTHSDMLLLAMTNTNTRYR